MYPESRTATSIRRTLRTQERKLRKVAPCAWVAESESDPGRQHMVAYNPDLHAIVCTCEGHRYNNKCWHADHAFAAVRAERQSLPQAQEPVEVVVRISIDANGVTVK